ncbi:MAG: hypothetical protein WCD46_14820, partial [Desulfobacterales bacterium]
MQIKKILSKKPIFHIGAPFLSGASGIGGAGRRGAFFLSDKPSMPALQRVTDCHILFKVVRMSKP